MSVFHTLMGLHAMWLALGVGLLLAVVCARVVKGSLMDSMFVAVVSAVLLGVMLGHCHLALHNAVMTTGIFLAVVGVLQVLMLGDDVKVFGRRFVVMAVPLVVAALVVV